MHLEAKRFPCGGAAGVNLAERLALRGAVAPLPGAAGCRLDRPPQRDRLSEVPGSGDHPTVVTQPAGCPTAAMRRPCGPPSEARRV
jgi:hypothetical protein